VIHTREGKAEIKMSGNEMWGEKVVKGSLKKANENQNR